MRKILTAAILTVSLAISLISCASRSSSTAQEKGSNDSTLIIYYSQTGATRQLAEQLKKELGADIVEIEPVEPYDSDYNATISRWIEEVENNKKVPIKSLDIDLDDYNKILLCFPVWGGTYALPVKTFLDENDLKGKTIVTFATFGSGGIATATNDLANAEPDAKVIKGYGVRNARMEKMPSELDRYLIENGYKEGVLEQLAAYEEPTICNEEAVELFNKATSGYRYPLGQPVTVAKRKTPNGTDYRFQVKTKGPDGEENEATVYVTVDDNEGAKPEFTEVLR